MGNTAGLGRLTSLKFVVTCFGLLFSILQVRIFGTSSEIENYFAATTLTYLLLSFAQTGQLAEIFLPIYLNIKANHGRKEAHLAFSVVINRLLVGVTIVLVIGMLLSSVLVKIMVPGFGQGQQNQVVQYFIASLPSIALTVVNSFLSSLLNAERGFGKSETSAIFSLIISVAILLTVTDSIGPWVLLLSLYLGQIAELITSILFLRKFKIRYTLIFKTEGFSHGDFFKNLKSTSLYVICSQFFTVALTSSISFLPQGVFAMYRYSLQIFERVFGIMIMPLSTIFFTNVSEFISLKDFKSVKEKVVENLEYGILVSAVALSVVVVAGYDIISLLWASKKFGISSIDLVYKFILIWFFILIIQTISMVFRRTAVSLNLARKQYNLSALSMVFSSIIAYFAIRNLGVNGLFLSIITSRIFFLSVPIGIVFNFKRDIFGFPKPVFCLKVLMVFAFTILCGYFLQVLGNYFLFGDAAFIIDPFLYTLCSILLFLGFSILFNLERVLYLVKILRKKKII